MSTTDEIRRFVTDDLNVSVADGLTDDYPLLERAGLDSTGLLELVNFLEERFGVEIDEEDIVPDHFGTIADMAALVESKKQPAA